jgi:MarR family transcriptional regulator, 2-MHQ and catechol-resistance regulon repressor
MLDVLIQTNLHSKAAAKEEFLPVIRELVRAYQALYNYSALHVRELGLTPSQFDVISTLGNTSGMSMNKLGEKTLITKGTLTGIIDRLEQKGLVRREVPEENRRSFTIVLTLEGEKVFEEAFPAHIAYLKQRFEDLNPQEMSEIQSTLKALRERF